MNNTLANVCPNCGSNRLNKGEITIYANEMHQTWGCNSCLHSGTSIYKLSFEGHFWVADTRTNSPECRNYTIKDLKSYK